LWSLAVILFRMIAGEKPFDGPEVGDLMIQICMEPLPVVSARSPALPRALDQYFARPLAPDPDARFQSAADMAAAFQALVFDATGAKDFEAPLLSTAETLTPQASVTRLSEGTQHDRAKDLLGLPARSEALASDTLSVATSGAAPQRPVVSSR